MSLKKSPTYPYRYQRSIATNLELVNNKMCAVFLRQVGELHMEFLNFLIENNQFVGISSKETIH